MRCLSNKGDILLKATRYFVTDNVKKETSISMEKIEELIKKGRCIFLIDNVRAYDLKHTELISNFIKKYGINRYIITIREEFFQALDIKKLPNYGVKFKKVFVGPFRKNQVRELVEKWANGKSNLKDIKDMVKKIDGYCNQINLAKTPFNISIFLVLWDFNKNFVPQNEAYIMDNYLEVILEKLSAKESDRNTYAYPIKQDFMSNVAYYMLSKNQYYFTKQEFKDFVDDYHKRKGYKIEDTKFDILFFEKNILCYSGEYIFFKYTSIMEYYLALYAKNNKEFLDYMINRENRYYFQNEILFYSGLTPNCKNLLDQMAGEIMEEIDGDIAIIDELNQINITTDFKLSKEEIEKLVFENRLTQMEVDEITDCPIVEIEPLKIDKKGEKQFSKDIEDENFEVETEDFLLLVQMYGSVLKNAELLDNKDKVYHLGNYMCAMNIILAKMLKIANLAKQEMVLDTFTDVIDQEDLPTEEEFESIKSQFYDVLQISIPIGIQMFISENVGTPKLELAIDEILENKVDSVFEKFMFILLKCDLGIGNIENILRRYIKEGLSHSILKIIEVKLIFYIQMRVWDWDKKRENAILDLLVEINFELYPEVASSLKKEYNYRKSFIRNSILNRIKKEQIEW